MEENIEYDKQINITACIVFIILIGSLITIGLSQFLLFQDNAVNYKYSHTVEFEIHTKLNDTYVDSQLIICVRENQESNYYHTEEGMIFKFNFTFTGEFLHSSKIPSDIKNAPVVNSNVIYLTVLLNGTAYQIGAITYQYIYNQTDYFKILELNRFEDLSYNVIQIEEVYEFSEEYYSKEYPNCTVFSFNDYKSWTDLNTTIYDCVYSIETEILFYNVTIYEYVNTKKVKNNE